LSDLARRVFLKNFVGFILHSEDTDQRLGGRPLSGDLPDIDRSDHHIMELLYQVSGSPGSSNDAQCIRHGFTETVGELLLGYILFSVTTLASALYDSKIRHKKLQELPKAGSCIHARRQADIKQIICVGALVPTAINSQTHTLTLALRI
jgi:hypothetical protein